MYQILHAIHEISDMVYTPYLFDVLYHVLHIVDDISHTIQYARYIDYVILCYNIFHTLYYIMSYHILIYYRISYYVTYIMSLCVRVQTPLLDALSDPAHVRRVRTDLPFS